MGYHQVPHDCLKCLRVGRHMQRIHGWDEHAGIGHSCGKSAVPPDDADDLTACVSGELKSRDEVRADLFFKIAAADGEDEDCVVGAEPTDTKPAFENRGPAFVVCTSGQLGDIISRRISFKTGNLPEVVDRVRGVGGAAADTEDEKAAVATSSIDENGDGTVDGFRIEAMQDFDGFGAAFSWVYG